MGRKKRVFSTFNLSFLDIMSCGFGAVVLLFLIIKHDADTQIMEQYRDLQAEANLLDEEVREGQQGLVRLRNILSDTDQQLAEAQGLARRIREELDETKVKLRSKALTPTDIASLQEEIRKLEVEKDKLSESVARGGQRAIAFSGDGDRQYLTGLKLGGKRNLILLDASASMLDETIVNVVRKRYMSDTVKRNSPKWQRSVRISQWLLSQLPVNSQFQIYLFNDEVRPLLGKGSAEWLNLGDKNQVQAARSALSQAVPAKGTSLIKALNAAKNLSPRPDNIYLITDGLPTQGMSPPRTSTISGQQRFKLYKQARDNFRGAIPINVILLPFEGDPLAAYAFWDLSLRSRGSFLTPASDWP